MIPRDSTTAVIPVHNRADLLAQLLDSMAAQTLPFAEVVVIDNASTDGAGDLARSLGYRVIRVEENLGFARAVNLGWRAASGSDWVAILNSDVTLGPQWLERLILAATDPSRDLSFATGTIFNSTDRQTVDGTYDLLSLACCAWRAGHGEHRADSEISRARGPVPIALAPGTACLYRREVLETLNGFDEEFGSYLEDVDLGLRCLREGYAGVYVPDAVAWHQGSATLGRWNSRVVRLMSRNQVLLIRRHYDRELFRRYFRHIVTGQLLWGLVALRHGAPLAWVAGKFDGLKAFRLEGAPSPHLRGFLAASESEIRHRARDSYWRWYFRLTSPFANASGAAH